MSLFTLQKITRTRYLLGKKQVPKGTPGAEKVSEVSKYWYAYRRHDDKQERIRLFTDKAASLTRLAKLNTALERGEAEMTDPRKVHLERPTKEHLDEFLPVMRSRGKSEKDKARKEAVLRAFLATLGPLSELTAGAIDRYLVSVRGSARNKKEAPLGRLGVRFVAPQKGPHRVQPARPGRRAGQQQEDQGAAGARRRPGPKAPRRHPLAAGRCFHRPLRPRAA